MKIIYKGTLPEFQVHRLACFYCKTIFEIQQHEGTIVKALDQRDSDRIIHDCPTCQREAGAYI